MFPVLLYAFVSIFKTYRISCFLHAWKGKRKNLQHNPKDRSCGFFLSYFVHIFLLPMPFERIDQCGSEALLRTPMPTTTNSSNKSLVLFLGYVIVYYGVLITSWLKCLNSHSLIRGSEHFSSGISVQIKKHWWHQLCIDVAFQQTWWCVGIPGISLGSFTCECEEEDCRESLPWPEQLLHLDI